MLIELHYTFQHVSISYSNYSFTNKKFYQYRSKKRTFKIEYTAKIKLDYSLRIVIKIKIQLSEIYY